ncbi:hypothetical protein [Novosphingobium huizhouense]|uniref:hypothetical protein n=1 Tax=Novosphingobium huizhouense TaxID=2866625 RepID=UPI001CD81CA1|nr:hypothetical protein [Novosphingobium huizhouense]
MAIYIPRVIERDGVLYSKRRVPKAVVDAPGALQRFFKGQRVSKALDKRAENSGQDLRPTAQRHWQAG